MKQALFYKKLEGGKIQCQACNHFCVIAPDKTGICGVRKNIKGKLYSLVYGLACAESVDPIEKKPFFHFLPGSYSLSIATVGCNFRCLNCQNWEISQWPKNNKDIKGFALLPEKIIKDALREECQSISYTYTEPTVYVEYALKIMKLAKKAGLKNVWVSNGYMSQKLLVEIAPYLDAINVDLKSFREDFYQKICGARLKPVLDNLKNIKKLGIWLEITTLIIPKLNDSKKELDEMAKFIKNEIGEETPWHLSRFSPEVSWQMQNCSPTPEKNILEAREIGLKNSLRYVYTGNISSETGENTYCPKCGELNIERIGYSVKRLDKDGKCRKCGSELNLLL